MGFISVTCSNCAGEGTVYSDNNQIPNHLVRRVTCNNCNGEGSNLAHAGSIGSYRLHLEPMIPDDSDWEAVFSRMDADIPDLVDLFTAEPT
jgi:hypothetical protein